jgi:hypothetical protein
LGEPGVGNIAQTVRRERGGICRRRKQLLVLKRAVSILFILMRSAVLSVGVNERFTWPGIKTILLVYAVGMELDLSFLTDELVHVGFGGEFFFWGGGGGGV